MEPFLAPARVLGVFDDEYEQPVDPLAAAAAPETLLERFAQLERTSLFPTTLLRRPSADELTAALADAADERLYICGDATALDRLEAVALPLLAARPAHVGASAVGTLIPSPPARPPWGLPTVPAGRVPRRVHPDQPFAAAFYPAFFEGDREALFQAVAEAHAFQNLTESTKPGTAYRTGIYLTPVEELPDGAVSFRLLRCSSNFTGPTAGFASVDTDIVGALNAEAGQLFAADHPPAELNHVLAQIYHNVAADPEHGKRRQHKAAIKEHADKTKDMPRRGGLMAFVSLYRDLDKLQELPANCTPQGCGDLGYSSKHHCTSALTTLRFRLKQNLTADERQPLAGHAREVNVTLLPNSVLLMPLWTNRYYTHEIRPPAPNVERLPTRMGYVVRCSAVRAEHRDGQTFYAREDDGAAAQDQAAAGRQMRPLQPPDSDGVARLRRLYAEENSTARVIDYGDVPFSLNAGDYTRPLPL